MLPIKFRVKWPFVSGEDAKLDFKDGCYGGHLGFPIRAILPIFDVEVTPMLPTKFQVNTPFGSGEEAKNRFSRLIPIETILAIFHLQATPMLPTKFRVNWPRGIGGVGFQSKLLTPHDAQRSTHDERRSRTTDDGRRTLTDHNSSS